MANASSLAELENEIFDIQDKIDDGTYLRIQNHLRDIHRQVSQARELVRADPVVRPPQTRNLPERYTRGTLTMDDLQSYMYGYSSWTKDYNFVRFTFDFDIHYGLLGFHNLVSAMAFEYHLPGIHSALTEQVSDLIDSVSDTPIYKQVFKTVSRDYEMGSCSSIRSKYVNHPCPFVKDDGIQVFKRHFNNLVLLILEKAGFSRDQPITLSSADEIIRLIHTGYILLPELAKRIVNVQMLYVFKYIKLESIETRWEKAIHSLAKRINNEKRRQNAPVYKLSLYLPFQPADTAPIETTAFTNRKNLGHISFPVSADEWFPLINNGNPSVLILLLPFVRYTRLNDGSIHFNGSANRPLNDGLPYRSFKFVLDENEQYRSKRIYGLLQFPTLREMFSESDYTPYIKYETTTPTTEWAGVP
jgi:hypothetical protein